MFAENSNDLDGDGRKLFCYCDCLSRHLQSEG